MLKAIHKKTGELVEAFKLRTDTSWVHCEKDEWIAPEPEVSNWIELKSKGIHEVQVSYIKAHQSSKNNNVFTVRDHFRIVTEGAIDNSENESEEHKLTKDGIYYAIVDDELNLIIGNEVKKCSEFGEYNLEIEERLSYNKKAKIGDVVMTFKELHKVLGKGIVFEVQISPQNKEKTEERTYDRVLQGYSVVWLWHGMFENNKLSNNDIKILPFREALKEYDSLQSERLNERSRLIDNKVCKVFLDLQNRCEKLLNSIDNKIEDEEIRLSNIKKEFFQDLVNKGEKIKTEMENVVSHLTFDSSKIDDMIKPLMNKAKDFVIIKVREGKDEFDKYIKNSLVFDYDSPLKDYDSTMKSKFGVELAEFVRTYLNAKMYDFKKEVNSDEKD